MKGGREIEWSRKTKKKKGEKVVKLKKLSEPTCCDFLYIYVCG